ncbi:TPA: hypothetical protein HA241_06355 [Candidatus Woesearchaeota archaeon]|nr:hypothetical protein [Candidatus Woesearchaeota archaeon]
MYTIGKFLGAGLFANVFRLKEYPLWCVKVSKWTNRKSTLEEQFAKAQILQRLGVPVPTFLGVYEVTFPSYFKKTIEKQYRRGEISWWRYWNLCRIKEGMKLGLVMETVESDLTLVSSRRVKYHFRKEISKVKAMGIKVSFDADSRENILWSQKQGKLYFIDFDFWRIPRKIINQ